MEEKLLLWLWFTDIFGEANPRKWTTTTRFDTIEECYYAFTHGDFYGLNDNEIRKIKMSNFENAKNIIEYCHKNHIKIYCYESEGFPQRLRDSYNPPSVLYAKTELENLDFLDDKISVAVVGSRNVDEYYVRVTQMIVSQLVESGITINSGFAMGVDHVAHQTALDKGGKTVAVLGSGIDWDYPLGTMKFKNQIAQNGVVFSEYPPLHKPRPFDFKSRNRILSGISNGVVVTQAGLDSGSLNTVSYGVSQGRDIFCVPPKDLFDERFAGVIDVLRDGAIPVFDGRDVLYEYFENYSRKVDINKNLQIFTVKTEDSFLFAKNNKVDSSEKESQNSVKKLAKPEEVLPQKPQIDVSTLTEIQQKIVESLKGKQLIADELSREIKIDIMDLYGELTELEIMGVIKSLPGKRYVL